MLSLRDLFRRLSKYTPESLEDEANFELLFIASNDDEKHVLECATGSMSLDLRPKILPNEDIFPMNIFANSQYFELEDLNDDEAVIDAVLADMKAGLYIMSGYKFFDIISVEDFIADYRNEFLCVPPIVYRNDELFLKVLKMLI